MTTPARNTSTPLLRDLPDEAQRIVAALEASLAVAPEPRPASAA
jgi:hypothetical protein